MRVVTFASTKGGVGKSTMAALTVDSLLRKGELVRIMDFDPQGSFLTWAEAVLPEWPNLKISEPQLGDEASFKQLYDELVGVTEEEADWLIIDTAGQDHFRQHPALAISDLVICPSGAVRSELIGVQKTAAYLQIALNQVDPDIDPLDMLRVLFQRQNGFPDKTMIAMHEILENHFGIVGEFHRSSAITSFLGNGVSTEQAIKISRAEKKDPKPFVKIQEAADQFTENLKVEFNG